MDSLVLEASNRSGSQKAKALRGAGFIPAVYYGRGRPTAKLQVQYQAFRKVFEKAGENTIIELSADGKKYLVLIYDIQYDPITDAFSHIDFIHVDMEKEVTTNVKIVIKGESPAVKNLSGILDVKKHEVKIKCLPSDLIHSIEVDVGSIVDFHTSVHVKDLKVPSTIKLLDNPEDTVVTATPPKTEKEEAPAAVAPVEGAAASAEGQQAGAPPAAASAQQPAQAGKEQKK